MKEYEMNELKLCSYCKSVPQANTWTLHGISETRYFCPNQECPLSVRTVTLEEWQTRPIEDELQKRIAELSQAVGLITTLKPTMVMDTEHPLEMAKEVAEYVTARIAELERDFDMLFRAVIAANKQSRKNTQTQKFVYGKEGEE